MKGFLRKLLKYEPVIFFDHLAFRIVDDNIPAIGAQLAYFLILSIFPFMIVLLNIISYTSIVEPEFIYGAVQFLPMDIQNIIVGFVNDIVSSSSQSLLSIAAIAGIWTASSGVSPVIRAINKAYDRKETRSFFVLKGISILFTIALLALFLLVIIALVFGEFLGRRIFEFLGYGQIFLKIWENIRFIIPMIFMILIFALLYKFSPCSSIKRSIKLRYAIPGAAFTTVGWVFISLLFSFYVQSFGKYATTYGSLGGVMVLLVWLYLSSMIMVLGGEINATIAYYNNRPLRFEPGRSILSRIIGKS
ncbi:YihY/virulence factor BrkB family protein [Tissierella creatinini]|nr:YihY/virulence factor BrkB family protein [Tissierella creatinini]TJX66366.1 YihY/virulence factor BrkB family protein [Soehngenia saccharolytica]